MVQRKKLIFLRRSAWGVALALIGVPAIALQSSTGEGGIEALRLHDEPYNLTGRKISIGQVEVGRPARFGLDKPAAENFTVRPTQLFIQNRSAIANQFVDDHAASVASVMISQDKRLPGVAPNARLYSAAAGFDRGGGQQQECLASQTVALQNNDDVRAINFSFGEPLSQDSRPDATLDGNALLTLCVDWSAQTHNVLYVIAGNQGFGGIPIPTDLYNGMTVANSIAIDGVYRKVSFSDLGSEPPSFQGRPPESNEGSRRSISIVAPGSAVQTIQPDGNPSPPISGTSFAAPHVTATVALLQEYGDRQLREQADGWSLDARRHEVMRAVMMNSADKLQDAGDGLLLGMTRTAANQRNANWLESDAYQREDVPLDANMGTGHLNAYRAYQQFSAGQQSADAPVSAIGWDYRTVGLDDSAPAYRDYVIDEPLQAGSFISATLAWDRQVNLQDANNNGLYDPGETFDNQGLNNLDIYLLRAEDDGIESRLWASNSPEDSVEHIFHQIPQTGRYKIRVVYRDQANDPVQNYAIAWWAVPAK
ncbi:MULTISPECIES: S8 family serine peptidase [unclassified Leptolyngbya]|uniref:S8 family serine peptidase n=1 Tax=unclassified Leptolyngbya TaxID=2650499 RepID=UPI0016872640|nr:MULTISPECIES: S8 family serine peptidase [unclassified Leptolyngbya]MBD1911633.1 S8 family serine peptidase [Leptolyngbya sp. FACHB-8]MBD2153198.1 S8 family serine peptidase [Leptolyngbya sp. FACHB-16]